MKVKLIRSPIGCTPNQQKNLQALGLRRTGQVKEVPNEPAIQGKINKVKHLLEVVPA
ncbi:MAG: 50S ribosomal protein L30 [Desulfovibrionales bacterium]